MPNEITLGAETQAGSAARAEPPKAKAAPDATAPTPFMMPPQGAGAPQRLTSIGAPPGEERFNVAIKVLRDPVARASFGRVYSGQARGWDR